MGDPKKGKKGGGSKAGTLLLLVLIAVIGAGAVGWFYPDTPVIGSLVHSFFKKGAEGVDKSGVYKVTVARLVLDPQEFKDGEKIDLQIVVKKVNGEKEEVIWDSAKLGDNLREVGKQPVAVNWQETPFEISWDTGEQVVVEVWDRKGISDTLEARFTSIAGSKEFPLTETRTLTLLDDNGEPRKPNVGGTNQITFQAERTGDLPKAGAANAE